MTMDTKTLKQALRNGPYAWPGGYPMYFITSDGAALSFEAVCENYRSCLWSMRHGVSDGWRIVGVGINWEDVSLTCDRTGKPIESAYGSEDDTQ